MALNKEVFKTRSLTALVFVSVMLLGLLWNKYSFIILFNIIHFGCWMEYKQLVKKITNKSIYNLLGIFYISLPVVLMLMLYIQVDNINQQNLASGSPLIYLNARVIPIGIILSIWINDTMAYLVGSFIGKTAFSAISPKKTWEGTAGGAILCVVVIGLLGYFIPVARVVAVQHWIVIAAICAIFGTAGDLLESKIKRMANVKDSGSFMPGHGGFLDRFDSLLIATPFVYVYVKLFIL